MPATIGWNLDLAALILRRAAKYIDSHSDESFTVADIAEHCKCNLKSLNLAFQRLCQCNASAFVRRYRAVRLRGAIKSDPSRSEEDSAKSCGTRLTPTLQRTFNALHGVSVQEFREQCIDALESQTLRITQQDCINAADVIEDAIKLSLAGKGNKGSVSRLSDANDSGTRKAG